MNREYLKTFCFIIFIKILIINDLEAQSRFRGGVVAGFNAAQLDGDAAAGYHKVGLNTGLRVLIELGGRLELCTEILYSQRGSRTTENESAITRSCTLNYLEVPVLLNIRDWKKAGSDGVEFYKASFSAGISYGRLFKATSSSNFTHAAVLDKFSTNDVSFMAGINYNANRHLGFSMRIAKSMARIFNYEKYINEPLAGGLPNLKGHYLTFQTAWIF